jgi:hypothetical protein
MLFESAPTSAWLCVVSRNDVKAYYSSVILLLKSCEHGNAVQLHLLTAQRPLCYKMSGICQGLAYDPPQECPWLANPFLLAF